MGSSSSQKGIGTIALGVGLGIGIPLLVPVSVLVAMKMMSLRQHDLYQPQLANMQLAVGNLIDVPELDSPAELLADVPGNEQHELQGL